jgi:adenine-specific DNA-methyltransferase
MTKIEILQKLKQLEGISPDERAYLINLVNSNKKYGLVWEDKLEDVEETLRENLPVLKELSDKAVINDEKYPNHILIEGDNLPALTALSFTHEGKIDVIYIDPPYNTGSKDFKYNDRFVDREDSFRHSKWLSFMHKRLKIAKRLLKSNGVIFVSIDDNEQAQLKLLMDEEFGERNFISNIIWSAGKKNDSKYISNSHEYVIAYFKNIDEIKAKKITWRERKDGIDRIYKMATLFVKKHSNDYRAATNELKKWFKDLKDNDPAKEHSHYSVIDEKGIFFPDNISWPGGGGPKYEVLHPLTKKPVAIPSRGWVYSTPERMQEIIDEGKVYFGDDENSVPTLKSYLKDREYQVPYSVIYKDGRAATKRLRDIFGYDPFDNPKDETVIAKLIRIAGSKNSIILDFFAGSGTTLHSTLQLNSEDGGSRQCILVTNNENNICEEVTYERNKRLIVGYTNSKGIEIEGLNKNNLRYFKNEFVSRDSSIKNKKEVTKLATELLCIKEDIYSEQKTIGDYQLNANYVKCFKRDDLYLMVIYDEDIIEQIAIIIQNVIKKEKKQKLHFKLYVFSNGQYPYTEEFEEVLEHITLCALPDAIYKAYQNVLPKRQRKTNLGLDEETAEEVEIKLENKIIKDLFN